VPTKSYHGVWFESVFLCEVGGSSVVWDRAGDRQIACLFATILMDPPQTTDWSGIKRGTHYIALEFQAVYLTWGVSGISGLHIRITKELALFSSCQFPHALFWNTKAPTTRMHSQASKQPWRTIAQLRWDSRFQCRWENRLHACALTIQSHE